ncbi:MAG: Hsp70 family protein [Deltaproteobacteria bacterium]|nr:Hsp70 family protein [Deltaproteobacteria bacterium]
MSESRFVVGIDLGTTNCVLAYANTSEGEAPPIRLFSVPQVTAPGTVEERSQLPSFLLIPSAGELAADAIQLPWGAAPLGRVVGSLAAKRAAESPERVVSSAKSWLCNARVDRTAPILPWAAEGDPGGLAAEERLSPLEASTGYLAHLRDAWDATIAAGDPALVLAEQDVFLTVPASFDAGARELTVRAAGDAGLTRVHLLEEPQAAVYSWVQSSGERWRELVGVGDVLLVCDVGGGTTDLSLILVDEEEGELSLRRVAVGDHILLGGDNMDLALAFAVRERLRAGGTKLDAWQFRGLVQGCREAKERLLGADAPDAVPISVLGRGRKLIGGTVRTDLARSEVEAVVLDGFLPAVATGARVEDAAGAGLSEIGLPFARDPAITRHLATFLEAHRGNVASAGGTASASLLPSALLLNGGVMAADSIRGRLGEVLASWASESQAAAPRLLPGTDLAHAVARGAAYYGLARRGRGVRIRGGTARSYYVGVASAMPAVPGHPPPVKALCVVPFGIEEGTELDLPNSRFGLLVGETATFRFFASTVREQDSPGQVLDDWETEELEELAPLSVRLEGESGARVPVHLAAHVTEIGTLELYFAGAETRWKLEFTVREPSTART